MNNFPLKFSAQVPGGSRFVMALQRFSADIKDFTPFWHNYFLPTWYSYMLKQYESEGASTGERWAALSDNYKAWKMKHWPGQPIGVLTGRTRASLTNPGDPNAYALITPSKFAVGTQLDYPMYLQVGTSRMPARPPLRLTEEFVMTDVAKLLQKFAYDTMRATKIAEKAS